MPPALACSLLLLVLLASAASAAPSPWGTSTESLGWGLDEENCPYVTPEVLDAFIWRGASDKGTPPLTKFQAANLACALKRVLARADAGNDTDTENLFLLYRRWRSAYRPHVWHRQPVGKGVTQRFPNWLDNLRIIIATNEQISLKHWAGLNAYSDMTSAEFAAHVLMAPTAPVRATPGARKLLARGAATTSTPPVNWLTAGRVLPTPRFAAQCGSSWAFAAADAVASNLLISSRSGPQSLKAVSAQHIMDCTAHSFNYTSPSCAGGSVPDAFTLASQRGLAADTTWVYRPAFGGGEDRGRFRQRCDQAPTPKQVKGGMLQVSASPAFTQVAPGKAALTQALASQPAVALISVDPSFQHYAGGVWSPSTPCAELPPSQHALLVVGFDTALGVETFIVKNSLGAGWGERGVGRIAATTGMCLTATYQVGAVSRVAGSGMGKFYRMSLQTGGGKSG